MSIGGLFQRVVSALARGALRSIAAALRRLGAGLKLFNWVRAKWGPLTSQEASQLYQLGQQYVQAGRIQQSLGSSGVINPQNVPYNPAAGATLGPGNIVQYHTAVQLYDPATGSDVYVTIFVDSPSYLTTQEIAQQAGEGALNQNAMLAASIASGTYGDQMIYSGLSIIGIQRGA